VLGAPKPPGRIYGKGYSVDGRWGGMIIDFTISGSQKENFLINSNFYSLYIVH
jgi:hypothetical protein